MFGNDRERLRRFYQQCWQKQQQDAALDVLEQQVAQVIAEHPEYHAMLLDDKDLQREFFPEQGTSNPFLHLGLHLGLREQMASDRPAGIAAIYQQWVARDGWHHAEHQMMECLVEAIWHAQQNNIAPDDASYLDSLQQHFVKTV